MTRFRFFFFGWIQRRIQEPKMELLIGICTHLYILKARELGSILALKFRLFIYIYIYYMIDTSNLDTWNGHWLVDVDWCWLQCPTSVPPIAVQSGACQRIEEATQKKRLNHRRARHVEHSLLRSFYIFSLPLVLEQMTLGPQHQSFLRWFAHSLLDLTGTVLNCFVIASCGT